MTKKSKYDEIKTALLDEKTFDKICQTVLSGDRVEIVPSKSGIKILRVRRNELNIQASS